MSIFDELIAYANAKYPMDQQLHDKIIDLRTIYKREVYDLENEIDDLRDDVYRLEKSEPDQSIEEELQQIKDTAEEIVQKHRCNEYWDRDALNLLYGIANKVV